MLTNFFSKSKPITVLLILGLFLCYYTAALLTDKIPIFNLWAVPQFLIVFGIIGFIKSKNTLTKDSSYAFLLVVLLIGVFPYTLKINNVFYVNLTLLLFLRKVYSLQSSKQLLKKLFDGGLWLGITFLIEPKSILFGFLFYAAILFHQTISFRTIFIPVIGFFSPVFLFFTYQYWFNKSEVFYNLFDWTITYNFNFYDDYVFIIPINFILLLTFLAILYKSPKALAVKNSFRKNWILILCHLFLAALLLSFTTLKNGSELLYVFFPIAIIIANGIELLQKKWISEVVFIAFLVCSVVVYST